MTFAWILLGIFIPKNFHLCTPLPPPSFCVRVLNGARSKQPSPTPLHSTHTKPGCVQSPNTRVVSNLALPSLQCTQTRASPPTSDHLGSPSSCLPSWLCHPLHANHTHLIVDFKCEQPDLKLRRRSAAPHLKKRVGGVEGRQLAFAACDAFKVSGMWSSPPHQTFILSFL